MLYSQQSHHFPITSLLLSTPITPFVSSLQSHNIVISSWSPLFSYQFSLLPHQNSLPTLPPLDIIWTHRPCSSPQNRARRPRTSLGRQMPVSERRSCDTTMARRRHQRHRVPAPLVWRRRAGMIAVSSDTSSPPRATCPDILLDLVLAWPLSLSPPALRLQF